MLARILGTVAAFALLQGCSVGQDEVGGTGGPDNSTEPGPGEQSSGATGGENTPPHGTKGGGKGNSLGRPAQVSDLTCANDASVAYYLSADDSNSMASPAHARELLRLGRAPAPAEIRTYEFLNYYNVRAGQNAEGVSITAHMAQGPASLHQLLVTVESGALPTPSPKSLTLVVDTSGSMSGESLSRARAALHEIAARLAAGDRVSLLTWGDEAPLLEALEVGGPNDPALLQAIDSLEAGGGSDLVGALAAAYKVAAASRRDDGLNRVVLISDGGASTVDIDKEQIASYAGAGDLHGIYLMGVGTGPANGYDDELMDFVTDAGRGAYVYLDSTAEATRIFGERFDEVMDVAARDVQVAIALPGFFDIREFYGEGYSEDPSAIEPQHLAPNDSMAFYQTVSSGCPFADIPSTATIQISVKWQEPATGAERTTELTKTIAELDDKSPALQKAAAVAAFANGLATLDKNRLHAAHAAATAALASSPGDADLEEILELVQLHPAF